MNRKELEDRLIRYAVLIIQITESMPNTKASNHLAGQLLRSGTSPALNYGEAVSGESRRDFLHKIRIVLKELRESLMCLRIIRAAGLHSDASLIQIALNETNELVSIFVKSAETAQKNAGLN